VQPGNRKDASWISNFAGINKERKEKEDRGGEEAMEEEEKKKSI